MSPQLGQLWFRVGFVLVAASAVLLFILRPGTAEFIITVAALVIGLVLIAMIVLLVRRANR